MPWHQPSYLGTPHDLDPEIVSTSSRTLRRSHFICYNQISLSFPPLPPPHNSIIQLVVAPVSKLRPISIPCGLIAAASPIPAEKHQLFTYTGTQVGSLNSSEYPTRILGILFPIIILLAGGQARLPTNPSLARTQAQPSSSA